MQAAALSEDDEPTGLDEDGPVDDVQKHRRGESKRALQHAGGSNRPGGRLAAYIQPLPLDYQKLHAGFQQFIQAAGTRVWKRRIFTYAADCKVGALLTERPERPPFFVDTHLYPLHGRTIANRRAVPYASSLINREDFG